MRLRSNRCNRQSSWQTSIASVRDIKESLQEMKSGRHIQAKPRASRLMILARRPFGFTRECETSVSREVRDDVILREVEVLFEGINNVCEVVYIAGDADHDEVQ